MESAEVEDGAMGGERRKQLRCSSQPPWARKGSAGQKPAGTISVFKKWELYTRSLTLSLGELPEQIIKQTVDTKPEENMGIRREGEFVRNKLPKPE